MSTQKAITFWSKLNNQFPHERITAHVQSLESGKSDWFRSFGIANIAISAHCQIGRFGFDDKKYETGKQTVRDLLNECGLSEGMMQN